MMTVDLMRAQLVCLDEAELVTGAGPCEGSMWVDSERCLTLGDIKDMRRKPTSLASSTYKTLLKLNLKYGYSL